MLLYILLTVVAWFQLGSLFNDTNVHLGLKVFQTTLLNGLWGSLLGKDTRPTSLLFVDCRINQMFDSRTSKTPLQVFCSTAAKSWRTSAERSVMISDSQTYKHTIYKEQQAHSYTNTCIIRGLSMIHYYHNVDDIYSEKSQRESCPL